MIHQEESLKIISPLTLLTLISCSQLPTQNSASYSMAFDSMNEEKIQATAIKRRDKEAVCFEVSILMKEGTEQIAQTSNWTVAWVDKKKRYHLMGLNERDPASLPQTSGRGWKNDFTTCTHNVKFEDVKALVLTPKENIPGDTEGMRLNW